jgi:hypothetical protein
MNNKKALEVLINLNIWRRDNSVPPQTEMLKPSDIGKAIDVAIMALEGLEERKGIDEALVTLNKKLAVRYERGEISSFISGKRKEVCKDCYYAGSFTCEH